MPRPLRRFRRRRFLGSLLAVCLPVPRPVLAADEPVSLPFEFDPARDPAQDLDVALRIARAAGRHVIIDVGGEWCSWCHIMDRFFPPTRISSATATRSTCGSRSTGPRKTTTTRSSALPGDQGLPASLRARCQRAPAPLPGYGRARDDEELRSGGDARVSRKVGAALDANAPVSGQRPRDVLADERRRIAGTRSSAARTAARSARCRAPTAMLRDQRS